MKTTTDDSTVALACDALIAAVDDPRKIVLFGPAVYAGDAAPGDYQFLVIVHDVTDRFAEAQRLNKLLGRMLIPADVTVVDEEQVAGDLVPGTVFHEALTMGKVVAE